VTTVNPVLHSEVPTEFNIIIGRAALARFFSLIKAAVYAATVSVQKSLF